MKIKSRVNYQLPLILLIPVFIFASYLIVASQTSRSFHKEQILSPAEEKFEQAADLIVPWSETGCKYRVDMEFGKPCHVVTVDERRAKEIATLYNSDGSIWFRFSLSLRSMDSLREKPNKDFVPFATDMGTTVFLRMVAESKHWYEVEVNENTQATKFILKSDSVWAKTTWEYWLNVSISFEVDSTRSPLLDKPNGKVIEESSNISFTRVGFIKAEGDWAYVSMYSNQKEYYGWIRWRKGRDILVGCIFNFHRFPEIKTDIEGN